MMYLFMYLFAYKHFHYQWKKLFTGTKLNQICLKCNEQQDVNTPAELIFDFWTFCIFKSFRKVINIVDSRTGTVNLFWQ